MNDSTVFPKKCTRRNKQVDPVTDLLSVWRLSDGQLLLQMIQLDFTNPTLGVCNETSFYHYI